MNKHVRRYYQSHGRGAGDFSEALPLHEIPEQECSFDEAHTLAPNLPKGWYELAQLSREDRIAFIKGHWQSRLPFVSHSRRLIGHFFDQLDDIGIFLVQRALKEPYESQMVYSLSKDRGFFHGSPGARGGEVEELEGLFPDVTFPDDYSAFLKIHNGFSKGSDTGVLSAGQVGVTYEEFQEFMEGALPLTIAGNEEIDPRRLIPFYRSFNLPCYQVFYVDWYPEEHMGNLYYSGEDHTLSDFRTRTLWADNLAFPAFLDWLAFYLEILG